MLFSLLLASIMTDLNLSKEQGGALGSITLVAAAAGGLIFGVVADRHGRKRALMASVLLYSVFTALCGLSRNLWQLAAFRVGLGLGMGGEWASGAALVSETWPAASRGRAFAFMQSSWAIGFGLAAMVDRTAAAACGAGAACSSSACCRRSSRCGSGGTSKSRKCGAAPGSSIRGARFGDLFRGDLAPRDDRADADERVHAVWLVGPQHLGAGVPVAAGRAGRRRPQHRSVRRRSSSSRRSACGSATSRSGSWPTRSAGSAPTRSSS